ncbi:MAG: DUF2294 family protein [Verrucomicrobia bacterium]|jgi:uncharacterized protein YbcI|nr:DUF2294 family protein [Verrucomicrobiota bacterium]
MDNEAKLKQTIVQIVTHFEQDQMWITPNLISVTLEPGLLVVTLRGVTSQAERHLAEQEDGRVLLQNLFRRLFDSVKQDLEKGIENSLKQVVRQSRLNVDPRFGSGILLFDLGDSAPID